MDTVTRIAAVGVGGGLGAIARYLINISPIADIARRFPLPTFLINISGSFMIGFLIVFFTDRSGVNEVLRLGLLVGFLGGFTTFSAFEAEIYGLLQEREIILGTAYLFLSVLLGLIGVVSGVALAKQII
jgi:fluoride exporter